MSHRIFVIVSIALTILSVTSASAQHFSGIPIYGTDFYATTISSKVGCLGVQSWRGMFLIVSAPTDCTVRISYFDRSTGNEVQGPTYSIRAKQFKQIPVDPTYCLPKSDAGDSAEWSAVHVTSSAPVTVYLLLTGPGNGAMSRVLPAGLLGKKYVIATLPSSDGTGSSQLCTPVRGSSLFSILAVRDSTHVTITPHATTRGGHDGVSTEAHPYVVMLMRGQVYVVKGDTSEDIADEAGSTVTADKPISVWGGHEAALNGEAESATYGVEQRNVLFSELVPVEYWRTADYVSVPFVESPGGAAGAANAGDKLRVFTYDDDNSIRVRTESGALPTSTIDRFQSVDVENLDEGLSIQSSNGKPIMPVLFDYRQQNTSDPYPAPTMMPLSSWQNRATSQMFAVSDDRNNVKKRSYLTIIAQSSELSKIKVWTNGSGPKSITALPAAGSSFALPDYNLTGRRFEVSPGAFYLTADSGFLAYLSADYAVSLSYNFTGYGLYDYMMSHSTPLNERFGFSSPVTPSVTVAQNCATWDIVVRSRDTFGLSSALLLSDLHGDLLRRTRDSGYLSSNVRFTANITPLVAGDTLAQLSVSVSDSSRDATGYLWLVNQSGNDTLITLTYRAFPAYPNVDSLSFALTRTGVDSCSRFWIIDPPDGLHTTVDSVSTDDPNFTTTTSRTLPVTLDAGDSLEVSVCFHSRLPITPHSGHVLFNLDQCPKVGVRLIGSSTYSDIFATDNDFGNVQIGSTRLQSVNVRNTGKSVLKITGVRQRIIDPQFVLVDSGLFPVSLEAGESIDVHFRFSPIHPKSDSTIFDWVSDADFTEKPYSALWGLGVQPGLAFRPTKRSFGTWNKQQDTLWLLNPTDEITGQHVHVDSVIITAADRSDFSIVANQTTYEAMSNFDVQPRDSLWILVSFHPDSSSNPSARHARIIAYNPEGIDASAELFGSIGVAGVSNSELPAGITVSVHGRSILLHSEAPTTSEVFDILGQRVLGPTSFTGRLEFTASTLAYGTYIVRVTSGSRIATKLIQLSE